MVDKNLFLHDLAVVATLKDEGPYIKEWLDYHLAAGVEHFYLYNNDSSDNYEKIVAPYVQAGLVTSTDIAGKLSMFPAYTDAVKRFKFFNRYMAFIDLDEFIYPKSKLGGVLSKLSTKFYRATRSRRLCPFTGKSSARTVTRRRITRAGCWKDSLAAHAKIFTDSSRTAEELLTCWAMFIQKSSPTPDT